MLFDNGKLKMWGRPRGTRAVSLKKPITLRALIQRCNRRLPAGQQFRIGRRSRVWPNGRIYLWAQGEVAIDEIDLERVGRELKALWQWEKLEK